jgi:hypothetical protein
MATTAGQVTPVGGTELHVTYKFSMANRCANIVRNYGEHSSNLLLCYCKENGYKWSMNDRGFLKYL